LHGIFESYKVKIPVNHSCFSVKLRLAKSVIWFHLHVKVLINNAKAVFHATCTLLLQTNLIAAKEMPFATVAKGQTTQAKPLATEEKAVTNIAKAFATVAKIITNVAKGISTFARLYALPAMMIATVVIPSAKEAKGLANVAMG
jgi:hypothetical protein